MKKAHIAILCAALAAAVLTVTVLAATYDSSEDPLISLSGLTAILDERIAALKTEFQGKIDALSAKIDSSGSTGETGTPGESAASAAGSFEVVYALKGQRIMAAEPCEIILRAGTCAVVSPFDDQGLSDMTGAAELLNGDALTKNHYLLIPRGNDGRGVEVTSESAYVMVRGAYKIVEPEQ